MMRRDEVSDLSESFRLMVEELRRNREELNRYNAQLERTLARVRLMEDIEKSLSKFVPREVSNALQNDPEALERGKTPMDVSVLFLDVEGSTLFAESLGPKSTDRMIEVYFSRFLDCIYDNQGDINETAGDGLMLIFQSADTRQHAFNAVKTAIGIQRITQEIQSGLNTGEEQVRINIGICSGEALVGFTRYEAISGERITFTASGLTTIIAARLADMAKDGTVLVSGETVERLEQPMKGELGAAVLESLGQTRLKNVQRDTEVFRLSLN
jgi:class 3 adenylate cyclase